MDACVLLAGAVLHLNAHDYPSNDLPRHMVGDTKPDPTWRARYSYHCSVKRLDFENLVVHDCLKRVIPPLVV